MDEHPNEPRPRKSAPPPHAVVPAAPHHFAFAAEGHYSLQLGTAVGTLLAHLRPGLAVALWILDLDLEAAARSRVERAIARRATGPVDLHWLRITRADLGGLRTTGHLRPVTFARVLLPALLPAEVQTVVYLDSDLVVRRDLAELGEIDLDGCPVAAVRDYIVQTAGNPRRSGIADLADRTTDEYFNAGVLVMNLRAWRETALADRVVAFATGRPPLKNGDQDALNAEITDWRRLPLHLNVQSYIHRLDAAEWTDFDRELSEARPALLRAAGVLHFTGSAKPWEPWYRYADARQWRHGLLRSGALSATDLARWSVGYFPQRAVARLAISAARRARRMRRGLRRSPR